MTRLYLATAALALVSCATPESTSAEPMVYDSMAAPVAADLDAYPPSRILSRNDVAPDAADWGTFRAYFTDDTPATTSHLTGVAVIKPGMEIHPPHRHAEEEVLMVIRGEGTWSLLGEDRPARAGDILYTKPWDIHGIRNTGTTDLEFVVVKYNPAGIPSPLDPNPALGEFGLGE